MLLGFVGDLAIELFLIDTILEHADPVLEVVLNGLHHGLLALYLGSFGLAHLLTLLQHLALLKVTRQSHDLLLQSHLLSAPLDNLAALLAKHLVLELLLAQLLDLLIALHDSVLPLHVVAALVLLQFDVVLVLLQQVLELLLLLEDLLVVFDGAQGLVLRTGRPAWTPLRRYITIALLGLAN